MESSGRIRTTNGFSRASRIGQRWAAHACLESGGGLRHQPLRCFLLTSSPKCARFTALYSHWLHSAFVFLTGSCDRRQLMPTEAHQTKKNCLESGGRGQLAPHLGWTGLPSRVIAMREGGAG